MSARDLNPGVLGRLRSALSSLRTDDELKPLIDARDEVLGRYRPVFTPEGVARLSAEEFRDFLMFRNNRHWSGLQRLGPRVTQDMGALRRALLDLLDEQIPINQRLNRLLPGGRARVKKLGKACFS
jgi:hypothetical protein